MRIGSSIGLIAVGLILALAVDVDVEGLDLNLVGWILAAVGVIGMIISLRTMRRTRPVVAVEETYRPVIAVEEPRPLRDAQGRPIVNPDLRDPNARY